MAVTGVDGVLGSLTAKVVPTLSSSDKFVGSPNYGDLPVDDEGDIDGLIVDVTKKDFTPAIVNRIIVVSGGVVYGPQKIAQAVLVKKGAAEYTTEIGKAKAVLKERGIVNPLIITAESVKDGTDVVISQSDAELISVYNNRESFLESADVVFVLE